MNLVTRSFSAKKLQEAMSVIQNLTMQNNASSYDKILYKVTTGDTLSKILTDYYGDSVSRFSQYQQYLTTIKQDNPQIEDVDKIYPGQLILLRVPSLENSFGDIKSSQNPDEEMGICNADTQDDPYDSLFRPVMKNWQTMPKNEQDAFQALSPFYTSATIGIGSMAMTTSAIDSLFKSNTPALYELRSLYEQYKKGYLRKGQYDYQRRIILNRLQANLGPINKMLYGGKKPHEVIRVNRGKNAVATGRITQQADRLSKMSKMASKGGIVLSAVGLGVACHQVANAPTHRKKNEIVVESLASLATGTAYGLGVGLFFVSNPIGWVSALVIGSVGAGLSYAGGKGASMVYSSLGEDIDVANFSTIDKMCSDIFNKQ